MAAGRATVTTAVIMATAGATLATAATAAIVPVAGTTGTETAAAVIIPMAPTPLPERIPSPRPSDLPTPPSGDPEEEPAERWQRRLSLPVLIAALISVPAIFLTTVGDPRWVLVGHALNWASLAVFGAETLLLFLVSGHRLAWVRRHKWHLLITAAAVPAVIFALFPAQAMRLLHLARLVGTLRVRRAARIVRSGSIVATRLGLTGLRWHLLVGLGAVLAVAFVTVVLADADAWDRYRTIMRELGRGGMSLVLAILTATVLAGAGLLVARRSRPDSAGGERPSPYGRGGIPADPDSPAGLDEPSRPGSPAESDNPAGSDSPTLSDGPAAPGDAGTERSGADGSPDEPRPEEP